MSGVCATAIVYDGSGNMNWALWNDLRNDGALVVYSGFRGCQISLERG